MTDHKTEPYEKDLGIERVLLFSDAVVAIAITLLALELRVEVPEGHHLTFEDLIEPWHKYLAFFLSFVMIADFWRTHYQFFKVIKKMDEGLMGINTGWLFFIVVLPFATTLLSDHFGDTPAIFLYSLIVFLISVLQNFLWDYPWMKGHIDKSVMQDLHLKDVRLALNLDMLNGLVAVILSFFWPKLAFFFLFFKLPLIIVPFLFMRKRRRSMQGPKKRIDV